MLWKMLDVTLRYTQELLESLQVLLQVWNGQKRVFRELKGSTSAESFDSLILSSKDFLSQIVSYRLN